jgi:hypothetical protein
MTDARAQADQSDVWVGIFYKTFPFLLLFNVFVILCKIKTNL